MTRIHTHIGSVSLAAFILCASAAAQKLAPPIGQPPSPGPIASATAFCFGDGSQGKCPCDNKGLVGHGCQNSTLLGGALLWTSGDPLVSADTLQFHVSGLVSTAMSIVLQGDQVVRPARFGDGLLCIGGRLNRLYVKNAIGGVVIAPLPGDQPVTVRSQAVGDPLTVGAIRAYQVHYRDPRAGFCTDPSGGLFNVSNGMSVVWGK